MGVSMDLVQNISELPSDSWNPRATGRTFFDSAGNLYSGERLESPSIGWSYRNFVKHFTDPVDEVPGGSEFLELLYSDDLLRGEDLKLAAIFLAELPLDELRAVAKDPEQTIECWEQFNEFLQHAVTLHFGAVYKS